MVAPAEAGVRDLALWCGEKLGWESTPQAKAFTLAKRMGFSDADRRRESTRAIHIALESYLRGADDGLLLEDLDRSRSAKGRDFLREQFSTSVPPDARTREELMRDLGLGEDRRTIHVYRDEATGGLEVTYLAGYYDARPLQAYGLPAHCPLYQMVGLPSGRGFIVKYAQERVRQSTEVGRFRIFASPAPDQGYHQTRVSLRQTVERAYRSALDAGDTMVIDTLIQRLRAQPEARFGWSEYWAAFHQFTAERFPEYRGAAHDSLLYLPGPTPDVLIVKANTYGFVDAREMIRARSTRADLIVENLAVVSERHSEPGSSGPLSFSAQLRLPAR